MRKFAPLYLGVLISLAVCIPFFRGGYLLLLDWVIGPHTPVISPAFYGLQGGISTTFLTDFLIGILSHLLGSTATWIPIFLFFPLACMSISRAVKGSLVAKLAAGLFFSINPFVVERIYSGQLGVIYGYLLLPVLFVAVEKWVKREVRTVSYIVLIFTFMISIDVHYAWIGGLVVLIGMLLGFRDHSLRRSIPLLLVLVILTNIYLVIPVLGHPLPVNPADNRTLLQVFSTRSDPHVGLYVNVLGLYGFWRQMHMTSKSLVSGWPILLLAILLISVWGLKSLWCRNERQFTLLLAISLVVAYFFALGAQGPTGPLFNLLYQHLPGFSMMREPEKFSAILATGIAILLGEGLADISLQQTSRNVSIVVMAVGAILEIGYNPIIFWGIHGQIKTSKLPHDWAVVSNKITGAPGKTLVLPWHLYLSFPFTQNRIIANPGPGFLPGDVISGDNLQVGPVYTTSTSRRSAYVTWLTQNEYSTDNFGKLLAPIGVEYLVIYKTMSTGPTSWISQQRDLKVVYASKDIELVKNTDFAGLAQMLRFQPINNLKTLLAESNLSDKFSLSNTLDEILRNPVRIKSSNTSISYHSKDAGWLNLDTAFFPGWSEDNHQARPTIFGTLLFPQSRTQGKVSFSRIDYILLGYFISAITLVLTFVRLIFSMKRSSSSG